MVAIPGFYDKAGHTARRFEVEDLARRLRLTNAGKQEEGKRPRITEASQSPIRGDLTPEFF
jgi:hypothetical protein